MLSVFRAAEKWPSAIAVVTHGEQITFAELSTRVEAVSRSLGSMGILDDAGERPVALVARPSLASLEVLYTLLVYGVPVLLLHPRSTKAERERLVARAQPRWVLIPDEIQLPATAAPAPKVPAEIDPSRPLAIIPTSGTTGTPKLTLLSRRACIASAAASAEALELGRDDRWLLCLPLSHVGGLSIVTRSLLAGSAVVLFDPGSAGLLARLPVLAMRLVRDEVSIASFVPTTLEGLLRLSPPWRPNAGLRAVLLGGAATPLGLFERAGARGLPVRTTYGLTEGCSQLTMSSSTHPPRVEQGQVSSGRALPGVELAIGQDGRLLVRGPQLFSGYLGEAGRHDQANWFVTEDLARLEPDGELFVFGRSSDLIVTGGENVDPRRVEAVLEQDPAVEVAVVFGIRDDRFGEVVACALVAPADLDLGSLGRRLALELARHELPRRVALGVALRLLPNGKLDRAAIREGAEPKLLPWRFSP